MAFGPAPLPSIGLVIEGDTLPAGQFSISRSDNQSLTSTRLLFNRKLVCEYGEFTLTGQDATLTEDETLTAVNPAPLPGMTFLTFGVTGSYVLPCEVGLFYTNRSDNPSLTSTTLSKGRRLIAETGIYGVLGAPAERDMEMNADYRAFSVIGQAAGMTTIRHVTADFGSFSMAGQDAGYNILSAGNRTMSADTGYFWMTRSDQLALTAVGFIRGTVLYCDYGTFALSGESATLTGPAWRDVTSGSGSWVYVTPGGGVWTDVDPDS